MNSFSGALPIAVVAASLVSLVPIQTRAQDAQQEQESSSRWVDTIDWEGDLRLRYEGIFEEGEADRNRFRFRGRFGFVSELSDKLQFSLRLATSDGDPVSTNLDRN